MKSIIGYLMMISFNFIMLIYLKHNIQNIIPQCDMSMGDMHYFRRGISYNVGIVLVLNPWDRHVRLKRAPLPVNQHREKVGDWFTIICLQHQFPKIEDFEPKLNLWFLASIYTIQNNNFYTDIIFFWCQVK